MSFFSRPRFDIGRKRAEIAAGSYSVRPRELAVRQVARQCSKFEFRSILYFRLALSTMFCVIALNKLYYTITKQQQMVFIYEMHGGILIDYMIGHHLKSYKSEDITDKNANFVARNNRIKHFCTTDKETICMPQNWNKIHVKDINVYIVDGKELYDNTDSIIDVNLLLVSKSQNNDPLSIFSKFNPNVVILDNNVQPWINSKWEKYTMPDGIILHDMKKQGVFIYNVNNIVKSKSE